MSLPKATLSGSLVFDHIAGIAREQQRKICDRKDVTAQENNVESTKPCYRVLCKQTQFDRQHGDETSQDSIHDPEPASPRPLLT